VIHHDHITGKYIISICNDCNLQYKIKKFVPVYCHNLKNYDSHILITGLASYGFKNEEEDIISAIPNNEEKYISFSKKIIVDENIIKARVASESQKWHIDNNTTLGMKIKPMFEQTEDKTEKTIFEIRF